MRVVLFCLLILAALGANDAVRAQTEAGAVTQPAPAAPAPVAATGNKKTAVPASVPASVPTPALIFTFVALFVLGGGALYFAAGFASLARRGAPVGVESYWGGLGGGLGGWRITTALCYLIGSLLFAAALSAVAIKLLDRESPQPAATANAPAQSGAE